MAAASSAAQPERRNKKPLWVDVALAAEEKAIAKGVESTTGHEKPKEENQEPAAASFGSGAAASFGSVAGRPAGLASLAGFPNLAHVLQKQWV